MPASNQRSNTSSKGAKVRRSTATLQGVRQPRLNLPPGRGPDSARGQQHHPTIFSASLKLRRERNLPLRIRILTLQSDPSIPEEAEADSYPLYPSNP